MSEPCQHELVEPVILPPDEFGEPGEHVADVCVACLAAFEPGYGCPACGWEEVYVLEFELPVSRIRVVACPSHVTR